MLPHMMLLLLIVPTVLYAISWYMYKEAKTDTNSLLTKDNIYYTAVVAQVATLIALYMKLKPMN